MAVGHPLILLPSPFPPHAHKAKNKNTQTPTQGEGQFETKQVHNVITFSNMIDFIEVIGGTNFSGRLST